MVIYIQSCLRQLLFQLPHWFLCQVLLRAICVVASVLIVCVYWAVLCMNELYSCYDI